MSFILPQPCSFGRLIPALHASPNSVATPCQVAPSQARSTRSAGGGGRVGAGACLAGFAGRGRNGGAGAGRAGGAGLVDSGVAGARKEALPCPAFGAAQLAVGLGGGEGEANIMITDYHALTVTHCRRKKGSWTRLWGRGSRQRHWWRCRARAGRDC